MRNDDLLTLLCPANELREVILGFQDVELHKRFQSGYIIVGNLVTVRFFTRLLSSP